MKREISIMTFQGSIMKGVDIHIPATTRLTLVDHVWEGASDGIVSRSVQVHWDRAFLPYTPFTKIVHPEKRVGI